MDDTLWQDRTDLVGVTKILQVTSYPYRQIQCSRTRSWVPIPTPQLPLRFPPCYYNQMAQTAHAGPTPLIMMSNRWKHDDVLGILPSTRTGGSASLLDRITSRWDPSQRMGKQEKSLTKSSPVTWRLYLLLFNFSDLILHKKAFNCPILGEIPYIKFLFYILTSRIHISALTR